MWDLSKLLTKGSEVINDNPATLILTQVMIITAGAMESGERSERERLEFVMRGATRRPSIKDPRFWENHGEGGGAGGSHLSIRWFTFRGCDYPTPCAKRSQFTLFLLGKLSFCSYVHYNTPPSTLGPIPYYCQIYCWHEPFVVNRKSHSVIVG